MFRQAGAELGRLWALLPARDPVALAGEVLALLDADGYGVTDELLEAASPALGPDGRAELRRQLQARLAALPPVRGRDDFEGWRKRFESSLRLRTLADLEQDVDAFIAAAEVAGRVETLVGEIAERLIAHGRADEALSWLERAHSRHDGEAVRHIDLRIAALDALGRKPEAQALRWETFCRWLSATHLRPYLRGLPDFEDVEAEDRAMAHALAHPDRHLALAFLVAWPNLEAANRLVRAHHGQSAALDRIVRRRRRPLYHDEPSLIEIPRQRLGSNPTGRRRFLAKVPHALDAQSPLLHAESAAEHGVSRVAAGIHPARSRCQPKAAPHRRQLRA